MPVKPAAAAVSAVSARPSAEETRAARSGGTALERLASQKGKTPEQELARLKKAAKEFESFFTYQMLKTMRETTLGEKKEDGMFGDGLGKGMFTDMFDMELSRSMSISSPKSIASVLARSLEKRVKAEFTHPDEKSADVHPLRELHAPRAIALHAKQPAISTAMPPIHLTRPTVHPFQLPSVSHPKVSPAPNEKANDSRSGPADSIRARYGALIDQAAARHGVDSALIEAVIAAESSGDPQATSPVGAQGLMQLMPDTAAELGVKNPFSPADSIDGGTRYLAQLHRRFGSIPATVAAYNAGPGRVAQARGIPSIAETRAYVARVLSHYETAKQRSDGPAPLVVPKEKPLPDR